jgi:signal transduction histidine kinase
MQSFPGIAVQSGPAPELVGAGARTNVSTGTATTVPSGRPGRQRLVPSEQAFLRFACGLRLLLALVANAALLPLATEDETLKHAILAPYLVYSGVLLLITLRGNPRAASPLWYWIDAIALALLCRTVLHELPALGALLMLPIIAMALQVSLWQSIALAVCAAVALVAFPSLGSDHGGSVDFQLTAIRALLALLLISCGPIAALLAQPTWALRRRLQWLDAFAQQAQPRQGMALHADAALAALAGEFGATNASLNIAGPEPRIFVWQPGQGSRVIPPAEAQIEQVRLARVPPGHAVVVEAADGAVVVVRTVDLDTGRRQSISSLTDWAWAARMGNALVLPTMSYGQAAGHVCLFGTSKVLDAERILWVRDLMQEIQPALERADLLEQLQRESAVRERERIGRDLHDSAVQPYVGLRYGLEALARQAGPNNPVTPTIKQLLHLATEELQNLRDVVAGLRRGADLIASESAPLAALQRQVERFEALYGLKVHIFAPHAPRLRGALGKAILHMVNESLTNVRRHTDATAVTVLLDVRQTDVILKMRNDHGPDQIPPDDFVPRSITERAADFGGQVQTVHESNFTEVTITLPMTGGVS